ncbi:hypothetical protein [Streptomyces roseoverticillatus]|uniref:hypothetical protein n=1 Tax=Streptomyces roseoverticillatus TaxID=66429 RepID=UPI0004C0E9C1|nr:hypothetical protein [Streptomyces roseoverticillatus]
MNESAFGQPLLDYAIITEPFPLYAATDGAPPTTLHIVVSNGGAESVYCREIIFSLPHGDLAQSLVDGDKDGKGSADGWTVEQLQPGAVSALPEGDYEHFRATHQDEKAAVDRSGITITLKDLRIGKQPGTARVEIRETATKDLGNWPPSVGYTTCAITKFPAPAPTARDVYDFHAEKPEVTSGGAVHLTWRGPRTLDYTVSYGSGAKAADGQKDTVRDLQWDGTVTRDTTFYLTYVIADATYCLTTTVTVPDPQLTALHVDGDATVGGSTTLGALTAKGTVTAKDTLTVAGALTAQDALSAEKGVSAGGSLTFGKWAIFKNQYENLKVQHDGTDMFDVQSSDKLFTVYGPLLASDTTDLVGPSQSFDLTWGSTVQFTAPTSGLLIGVVNSNGGSRIPKIEISSDGHTASANARRINDPGANGISSTSLAIRKGHTCTIWFGDEAGSDGGKDYKYAHVIWCPLGKGPITLQPA